MTRNELAELIQKKELVLSQAKSERDSWNNGKYKNSTNAKISKLYVESLQQELSKLRIELHELDHCKET